MVQWLRGVGISTIVQDLQGSRILGLEGFTLLLVVGPKP